MDPNETLKQLREYFHSPEWNYDDGKEIFDGLDQWLSRGGFLPDDWKR